MGEIASKDESDFDSMPPLKDASDTKHAVVGQTLVVSRAPHVQAHDDKDEPRHDNIFYILGHVKELVVLYR